MYHWYGAGSYKGLFSGLLHHYVLGLREISDYAMDFTKLRIIWKQERHDRRCIDWFRMKRIEAKNDDTLNKYCNHLFVYPDSWLM